MSGGLQPEHNGRLCAHPHANQQSPELSYPIQSAQIISSKLSANTTKNLFALSGRSLRFRDKVIIADYTAISSSSSSGIGSIQLRLALGIANTNKLHI
ncbi:hypothetical protein PtB15_3B401 [Puccinia triticina]|nr:hypothetical protein PtB15_3B401 [Puccinia triticina]